MKPYSIKFSPEMVAYLDQQAARLGGLLGQPGNRSQAVRECIELAMHHNDPEASWQAGYKEGYMQGLAEAKRKIALALRNEVAEAPGV